MNSTLQELLNCCRCCLNLIKSGDVAVAIDETVKNNFFDVTGYDLLDVTDQYSSIVCENCYNKLYDYAQFRKDLIECQNSLYQMSESLATIAENYDVDQKYTDIKIEYIMENQDMNNEIVEDGRTDDVNVKEQSQRLPCYICDRMFAASGLYHHIKRAHHTGTSFECDKCAKSYNLKNDLILHMKRHMSKESRTKYPCSYCESILLSKSALENHFKTFHSDVVEIHPCDLENCDKSFQTRIKLLQHMKTAHEIGNYICETCNKFYSTRQYLQKHIIQCHQPKVLEECNVCGKKFPKGTQMKRHMKNHENILFQCSYENCGKVYHFKPSLLKHIETHHEPLCISCEHCGYSFPTQRHLNRHISRQHSQVKVECEVQGCGQLFGRKDYLASHYKNHKNIDETTKKKLIDRVKNIKVISW